MEEWRRKKVEDVYAKWEKKAPKEVGLKAATKNGFSKCVS